MATINPFDVLGDSENDDPSVLIAATELKIAAKKPAQVVAGAAPAPAPAKLPSKPLPPAQAVRETKNNTASIRDGRGGVVRGRGGRGVGIGQNRDFGDGTNGRYGAEGGRGGGYRGSFASEDGETGKPSERGSYGQARGSFRGGRRGGYVNGGNTEGGLDSDLPQRRIYERRSGTGRGYEMKREGAGRGNWGTVTDEVLVQETEEVLNIEEKAVALEKNVSQDDVKVSEAGKDKEDATNETVEKEPEDNEMTLEEYEKIREDKRKALLAMKVEERKVEVDKDFETMQQLAIKKSNDIFIKLGSDKDLSKRRDGIEKEERSKKAMNINDFLKPAEGGKYYGLGGRGRGRGRGPFRGGYNGGAEASPVAPSIEDQGQFPSLGGK